MLLENSQGREIAAAKFITNNAVIASEKQNYCRNPNKTNPRSVGAVLLFTAFAVLIKKYH